MQSQSVDTFFIVSLETRRLRSIPRSKGGNYTDICCCVFRRDNYGMDTNDDDAHDDADTNDCHHTMGGI